MPTECDLHGRHTVLPRVTVLHLRPNETIGIIHIRQMLYRRTVRRTHAVAVYLYDCDSHYSFPPKTSSFALPLIFPHEVALPYPKYVKILLFETVPSAACVLAVILV